MSAAEAKGSKPLKNQQHETFCLQYFLLRHVTKAAEAAGYSAKTAAQQGSRLLKSVKIRERVAFLQSQQQTRVEVNSDDIRRELNRLGYSDPRPLFHDDGRMKDPKDWPEDLARAIASIECDEIFEFDHERQTKVLIGYTKKVKFWSKPTALTLLAQHNKLLTQRVEHDFTDALAEKLAKARKRVTQKS